MLISLPTRGSHHGSVKDGFETSLRNLNISYIDLYLMHWPMTHLPDGAHSALTICVFSDTL